MHLLLSTSTQQQVRSDARMKMAQCKTTCNHALSPPRRQAPTHHASVQSSKASVSQQGVPKPHLNRAQGQGIIQQVTQGRRILPCDRLDRIFTVLLLVLQ